MNYPVIYVIEANDNKDKCVCPACLAREEEIWGLFRCSA